MLKNHHNYTFMTNLYSVHLKLKGSVKPFLQVLCCSICAFISELSIKVKSEYATIAMNIGTTIYYMERDLWFSLAGF